MPNYAYTIFGLNLKSEIEFPELIRGNDHMPDLFIAEGCVPDNLATSLKNKGKFQNAGKEFLFKSKNSGKFLIRNDNQVIFQRYKNSTYEDVRVLFLSVVLGIVLHKKEKFPLHASAVEYNGKAILFAGQRGIGKSTLAAGFLKRGSKFISDDIAVIEPCGDKFLVAPSFPQIKLWPDSLNALGFKPADLDKLRPRVEKRKMTLENIIKDKLELHAIFFLSRNNMSIHEIGKPPILNKMSLLKENTFEFRRLRQIANTLKHFNTCCELAKNVPIKVVNRPIEGFELKKTMNLIMGDLNI